MENYTTNKEILNKLNQHYTSLGYCELSDSALMVAIRKAEKAIKPDVKLDKKHNRKYYEASFLDDAFEYILKNHKFTLKRNREYDKKQKHIKQTKKLLPCFDLLIGSSSTLGLTDVQFEKTAWFSVDTIINLSESGNVNDFLKNQIRVNLKKRVNSISSSYSFLELKTPDELNIKEFLSVLIAKLFLFDFNMLIINKGFEGLYSKEYLFDIKDYNNIVQRLYNIDFLDIENDIMPYLDANTVNDFVKNSPPSSKRMMEDDFVIEYKEKNEELWKSYL